MVSKRYEAAAGGRRGCEQSVVGRMAVVAIVLVVVVVVASDARLLTSGFACVLRGRRRRGLVVFVVVGDG